jgi:hypothetical protein
MATTQTFLTGQAGGPPADVFHRGMFVMTKVVDLSKTTARGAADVDEVLHVAKGTFVLAVFVKLITAEGATLTIDVGDGADSDGWLDNADMNAAAPAYYASSLALTEGTPNTFTRPYAAGRLYTADDTIDITWNNASADVCKLVLGAVVVPTAMYS